MEVIIYYVFYLLFILKLFIFAMSVLQFSDTIK